MKTWFQFLVSASFRRHLLLIAIVWFVVVGVAWIFLNAYSRRGEVIQLPDLRGMTLIEAKEILESRGLEMVHLDSVYSSKGRPFEIIEQLPSASSAIKPDRQVYLTTYRSLPPNETLGVEEGMDVRVARIRLENKGFQIEEVEEANVALVGRVVRVESKHNRALKPDARLPRGTSLRLVVGRTTNERVPMPNLIGLSLDSARSCLINARLSLGLVEYGERCEDAADSLNALVIEQHLPPSSEAVVLAGTEIDLYLGLRSDRSRKNGLDQNP